MQTISVRTSQNVVIQFPLASLGERILAQFIDWLVLIIYMWGTIALFSNLKINTLWVWISFLFIPVLFLNFLLEVFMNGQTLGKRLLKMQVVRIDGSRATIGNFVLRWLFSLVDIYFLSGAIAAVCVAAGGKGQRLGDIVAGTTVIKLVKQKEITANEIFITAEETYTPTFSQAIQLRPGDIELMQRALEVDQNYGNEEPLLALIEKIKSQLAIESDLAPQAFIHTLIKDYSHLTSRG